MVQKLKRIFSVTVVQLVYYINADLGAGAVSFSVRARCTPSMIETIFGSRNILCKKHSIWYYSWNESCVYNKCYEIVLNPL